MQQRKKKLIANNKKARHDYHILDEYEAGLVLTGTEIKSVRQGKVNLKESYVSIKNGEAVIRGMHISPYDHGNIFNVDPVRLRKLLLHKQQIRKIESQLKEQGLTVVPLSLYIDERGRAKLAVAVAKGKKLYDKREDIAKRDAKRRMQRETRR